MMMRLAVGTTSALNTACGSLAQVHWARIIIDEGHELGGKGLSELASVLGATLASATWVLSATPVGFP
jgi:hypothetical protein